MVATDLAGGFEPGEQACSIAFESLDIEKRRALRDLMSHHALGRPFLAKKGKPAAAPWARAAERLVAAGEDRRTPPRRDGGARGSQRRRRAIAGALRAARIIDPRWRRAVASRAS